MIDIPSLIIGAIIAGIFGYIFQQIRLNRNIMQSPDRPMTVVHRTDRTPNQVRAAAARAALLLVFWVSVFIAVLGGVVVFVLRLSG